MVQPDKQSKLKHITYMDIRFMISPQTKYYICKIKCQAEALTKFAWHAMLGLEGS